MARGGKEGKFYPESLLCRALKSLQLRWRDPEMIWNNGKSKSHSQLLLAPIIFLLAAVGKLCFTQKSACWLYLHNTWTLLGVGLGGSHHGISGFAFWQHWALRAAFWMTRSPSPNLNHEWGSRRGWGGVGEEHVRNWLSLFLVVYKTWVMFNLYHRCGGQIMCSWHSCVLNLGKSQAPRTVLNAERGELCHHEGRQEQQLQDWFECLASLWPNPMIHQKEGIC